MRRGRRCELGIVVEELVEPVDEVHPQSDGFEHDPSFDGGEHAARGRDPEDEVVGDATGDGDRLLEIDAKRDPVRRAVEHEPRIEPGLLAVDHREDLVLLGVADQTVRGLAVDVSEVRFGVHDGGAFGRG